MPHVTRFRFAAGLLAAVACASLIAPHAYAQAQDNKEFRVGGVLSLSGPFGPIGDGVKKGAELAIEMRGGKVMGVPIKAVWEDDETKPQVAVQKATRLLAEGVHMLFGAVSSGSTLAMMKLNEKKKVPLLVTLSASDDITGKAKNAYTFRTATTLDMENRIMAEYVVGSGRKKLHALISDYSTGRELWTSLRARLEARGITIVGEDFTPLGSTDYSVVINKLAKSEADLAAIFLIGNDAITFLKQAEQVKLKDSKTMFGTILMDERIGVATGGAGVGILSTLRYHSSIEVPANKRFVAAYQKRFGEPPSQYAGQAYDGMAWFLDVVETTKSWDPDVWVKAFAGSTRKDSVIGSKTMRLCDNQAEQPGFFGCGMAGPSAALPVVMQVTQRYEPNQLFEPCKP
jgi:ABC-type branched-subunit amino acid transport system substrate-binding protein